MESWAASDSHNAKAAQLLELINIQKQLSQIGNQMMMPMKQRLSMVRTSPAKAELIRAHIAKVQQLVNQQLSWEQSKSAYTELFANTYTEQELEELVAFFSSSTGRKYIADKPEFNQKLKDITVTSMASLKPQLDTLEKEFTDKMAKLAESEKAAAPQKP